MKIEPRPLAARAGVSPARRVAFDVLVRVEHGAWAADLLLAAAADLDARDAGLASEIVFGCLRFQAQLDWLIGRLPGKLDTEVRVALRMGLYQIRYLDRVPAHAAVGESVELVKRARKRSAAGLVNALLRRAGRGDVAWNGRATELSAPEWLLARWERNYGAQTAAGIARAFLKPPEMWVRSAGPPPPGVLLEPTPVAGCYRLVNGKPDGLRIQDIGSQSVVGLLELEPGMSFLDLCAAPGNKTAQALEYGVRAVACDRHLARLRALAGLGCDRVVLDGVLPLPFSNRFDRILVDAPCSGTGTLGRNPELKWRLREPKIEELHGLQVKLLASALERLAPGGRLVYSTCSLEPEENEGVVGAVPGAVCLNQMRRTPGLDAGDGFFAAVLTSG